MPRRPFSNDLLRPDSTPAPALSDLVALLSDVGAIDLATFRSLEFALVSHYRQHENDQEAIALVLAQMNLAIDEPAARLRIDEILTMLQHVHDPLIH